MEAGGFASIIGHLIPKCLFCQTQGKYLGHVVSVKAVQVDSSRIEGILEWPKLTIVKQLPGFLGLTGYYRKFVAKYAHIVAPLTKLLKKNGFN